MAGDTSEPKPRRSTGRLWIIGTTLLISWIGFSSQLFIVLPSFPFNGIFSIPVLKCLLPFNILLSFVFYNYYLCVVTNPGRVPPGWDPTKAANQSDMEVKTLTGTPRFCKSCKEYKPPRSHHCSSCRRCVLKMDHHVSPWVNNCVGHYNYGHFIRFLVSVNIACSYHLWMISTRVFGEAFRYIDPTTSFIVILILNYVACLPVIICVGLFSLYHFYLMMTNTTTIESQEKEKAATLRRKGRIERVKYPYDLGIIRNIKSVLGKNPLLWLIPQEINGDGTWYPTGEGVEPVSQLFWPPRDMFNRKVSSTRIQNQLDSEDPFTYGSGLNPNLAVRTTRKGQPNGWSNHPPYHPNYQEQEEEQHYAIDDGEDDDDDIPLGIRHKNVSVHVRRGSEGYEVRPGISYMTGSKHQALEPDSDDYSSSDENSSDDSAAGHVALW